MDKKKHTQDETPDDIETRLICETIDSGEDASTAVSKEKALEVMKHYGVDLNEMLES